jgi:hypothetical protein
MILVQILVAVAVIVVLFWLQTVSFVWFFVFLAAVVLAGIVFTAFRRPAE